MSSVSREWVKRVAARTALVMLLLAMTLQYLALSQEDRENVWLTRSLCARSTIPAR